MFSSNKDTRMTIEVIPCSDASSLLEALGAWERKGNFVFRGQSSSGWSLEPGIMRSQGCSEFFQQPGTDFFGRGDSITHENHELYLLKSFVYGCDKQGIKIPGDTSELREALGLIGKGGLEMVPYDPFKLTIHSSHTPKDLIDMSFYPLIAMAQHHGLPTRFLDWSRSSKVAAYFAVASVSQALMDCADSESSLCVWMLDFEKLNKCSEIDFRAISVPLSVSENARSQDGCFTTQTRLCNELMTLDSAVAHQKESGVLKKFTLPYRGALNLLKELVMNRISPSSIYPGPSGAVMESTKVLELMDFDKRLRVFPNHDGNHRRIPAGNN